MADLLLAVVTFTVLVALAVAALLATTAAPWLVACRMAEHRDFPTTRWGSLSLGCSVVGVGLLALILRSHHVPHLLAIIPVAATWGAVVALWLLEPGQARLGGRPGRHR